MTNISDSETDSEKSYLGILFGIVLIEFSIWLSELIYLGFKFDPRICVAIGGGCIIVLYFAARYFNKTSVEEAKRLSEKHDFIRIGWGLFFILVSLIIFWGSFYFTNSPSSDILGIYIAFYLTGVALLFDGTWPGKQDLKPLKSQNEEIAKTLKEILKKQDELSKRLDDTIRKIPENNYCLSFNFKYR